MKSIILTIIAGILVFIFVAPALNNLVTRLLLGSSLKSLCRKNKHIKLLPQSSKWLWGKTDGEHSDFHLIVGDSLYIVKICSVYKVLTSFTFESATLWKKYTYNRMAGFGGTPSGPKELCLNIPFDLAKEKKEVEAKLKDQSTIDKIETVLLFCPKAMSYNIKMGEDMMTAEPKGDRVFGSLIFDDETFVKAIKKQSKGLATKQVDEVSLRSL
ncbi:MAG: hypothetical protein RR090_09835 [Niameybacter sp.]